MKHSSVVLDACKDMREELKKSHHSKKECETIPSQLSNWYLILEKIDSIYDEYSENNFDRVDFEKAMEIFPKFQSTVSKYINYAGQKKNCVKICKVLRKFVSDIQSLLELNKQAFLKIDQYYACSANFVDPGLCWCSDDD